MRPEQSCPDRIRRTALTLGIAVWLLAVVGCSDGGGYTLMGMNESDHDVIVRLTTTHLIQGPVRMPAHTWGTLAAAWATPNGQVEVLDGGCQPIATLAFASSGLTVHVRTAGEVELIDTESWRQAPIGVEPAGSFARVTCP